MVANIYPGLGARPAPKRRRWRAKKVCRRMTAHEFGAAFRAIRVAREMSQQRLAELIGIVSRSLIVITEGGSFSVLVNPDTLRQPLGLDDGQYETLSLLYKKAHRDADAYPSFRAHGIVSVPLKPGEPLP